MCHLPLAAACAAVTSHSKPPKQQCSSAPVPCAVHTIAPCLKNGTCNQLPIPQATAVRSICERHTYCVYKTPPTPGWVAWQRPWQQQDRRRHLTYSAPLQAARWRPPVLGLQNCAGQLSRRPGSSVGWGRRGDGAMASHQGGPSRCAAVVPMLRTFQTPPAPWRTWRGRWAHAGRCQWR
jgi:hypothetical protein